MAEALGKKGKVRGEYKAYVTTVIAEVNEILPNYQPRATDRPEEIQNYFEETSG